MESSRLFGLITTLNNKEVKEIQLFLASPFFNKRPEVALLFDQLATYRDQKYPLPTKERLFQQLTSVATDYDDQQLRLWMSFLLKSIEKYLAHAAFFADDITVKTQLAAIYRQRNLPKHQERQLRELKKTQEQQTLKNADFYSHAYQIQLEQHRFVSANKRMSALNLQQMSDHLDIAYIAQKLQQSCIALSHQAVYKTEYKFGLLPEILQYIEQQQLTSFPAVAIYYYGYLTLSQPMEAVHFQAFKNELIEHGHHFPSSELGDLYILGINFCIKRYNAGDRQFLEDEFELYRQGLGKDLFLKNNQLSRFTYRNVVTVGLVQKAYEWVDDFIHTYKNKLDRTYRESMFSFSLAQLSYSRQQYDEALQLLQPSNYKDILLNLAAKTITLKIFYEREEHDLLHAHLDAMRTFIRRKNVMGYHQEHYVNLIHFARKLMEHNPFDKSEKIKLQQELQNMKVVAEREWLNEQMKS